MPEKLTEREVLAHGMQANHQRMDNGELRFRLMGPEGSGYIRVESGDSPGWQNSHGHARLHELILIQQGRMVYAELVDGNVRFQLVEAGEFVITRPGFPHNICMGAHAIHHAIKYGDCTGADWIPCPELDAMTLPLGYAEAVALADKQK